MPCDNNLRGSVFVKVTAKMVKEAVTYNEVKKRSVLMDAREDVDKMEDLPPKSERNIRAVYEDTLTMFRMVKDFYSGKFQPKDKFAVVTAVLAIIYLVSPLDLAPDVLPGFGYVDDTIILAYAFGVCANVIAEYRAYINEQSEQVAEDTGVVLSADPFKVNETIKKSGL